MYRDNREWSDQFIPAITQIVGPHLLIPAPLELDILHATDLIVFKTSGAGDRDIKHIAARVRRRKQYEDGYGAQFTVRSKLASRQQTELQKITEGFGDWMFYGFATEDDDPSTIAPWIIIDLHAFRAHLIRDPHRSPSQRIKTGETPNHDNATWFRWFDVASFPAKPSIWAHRSEYWPLASQADAAELLFA